MIIAFWDKPIGLVTKAFFLREYPLLLVTEKHQMDITDLRIYILSFLHAKKIAIKVIPTIFNAHFVNFLYTIHNTHFISLATFKNNLFIFNY